jgi:hypothetical protein
LLRRTLVHIGTFVLGSIAFVSLMSFVLVSIARGLLPSAEAVQDAQAEQGESGDGSASKSGKGPGLKAPRKKTPSAAAPEPEKND